MTKVLALNGSPSMDRGNTALILTPFLDGMREAGAEVKLFTVRRMNIGPCGGEYNCWMRTPGVCYQADDMQLLYPELREADVWVLATPLFVDGMPGPLKTVLDRMIPLYHPFINLHDGHCRHAARDGLRATKMVLVSNCGFWERDNFELLECHIRALAHNTGIEFAGALLRPHGPALRVMKAMGLPVDDVYEAAREAGRRLLTDGQIPPALLQVVSRDLLPLDAYLHFVNSDFRRIQEKWASRRAEMP